MERLRGWRSCRQLPISSREHRICERRSRRGRGHCDRDDDTRCRMDHERNCARSAEDRYRRLRMGSAAGSAQLSWSKRAENLSRTPPPRARETRHRTTKCRAVVVRYALQLFDAAWETDAAARALRHARSARTFRRDKAGLNELE